MPSLNLAFNLDNQFSPICNSSMDHSCAILSLVFMLEDRCHVVVCTSAPVSGRKCAHMLVTDSVIYMYFHQFTVMLLCFFTGQYNFSDSRLMAAEYHGSSSTLHGCSSGIIPQQVSTNPVPKLYLNSSLI